MQRLGVGRRLIQLAIRLLALIQALHVARLLTVKLFPAHAGLPPRAVHSTLVKHSLLRVEAAGVRSHHIFSTVLSCSTYAILHLFVSVAYARRPARIRGTHAMLLPAVRAPMVGAQRPPSLARSTIASRLSLLEAAAVVGLLMRCMSAGIRLIHACYQRPV